MESVFHPSDFSGASEFAFVHALKLALVTKARHVADPAERKKLYDQATEILVRETPSLVLWHRRVFTGYSGRVQGFTPHPDGIIRVKGLKLS